MCYRYLHKGKPFLKHLELKTCGWHNGRHLENFHCRVLEKITILVPSYKSYDHIVTPRRASSSYRLHVHTFVMHAPEWKVGPLRVYNTRLWMKKNSEDEEYARRNFWRHVWLALVYSSKYWKITLGKFLPTDLSSLFKTQQWLNPKKLGANFVKSLGAIMYFLQKALVGRLTKGNCTTGA